MKKTLICTLSALMMLSASSTCALAGTWRAEGNSYAYIENGVYAEGWRNINGKWYYFTKHNFYAKSNNSTMLKDCKQYINGNIYSFDKNGVMQTGWVNHGQGSWSYYYGSGIQAKSTSVGNYKIGSNGVWDKNPEYTTEMALNMMRKKYENEPDLLVSCSGYFDYKNFKKYYLVHVASKGAQALGGSGTIGNFKVYADGTITEN